jgi:hypothetical protein
VASPFKLLTSGIEGVRNLTAAWDNNLGWVLNWSPVLNATVYIEKVLRKRTNSLITPS